MFTSKHDITQTNAHDSKPAQVFFFIVAQVMAFLSGFVLMKSAYGAAGILIVLGVCVLWIMAMGGWSWQMRATS